MKRAVLVNVSKLGTGVFRLMGNRNMQGKSLWRELKLIDNVPVEFGWIRALAKDRASICNNQNTQDRAKKMYLPKSEVP